MKLVATAQVANRYVGAPPTKRYGHTTTAIGLGPRSCGLFGCSNAKHRSDQVPTSSSSAVGLGPQLHPGQKEVMAALGAWPADRLHSCRHQKDCDITVVGKRRIVSPNVSRTEAAASRMVGSR